MGKYAVLGVFILFLIFLGIYLFGIWDAYWITMIAIVFIIVGFVVGFLLLGSGSENMWVGVPLLVLGIILLLVVWLFPI
jgi:hypothetical protein